MTLAQLPPDATGTTYEQFLARVRQRNFERAPELRREYARQEEAARHVEQQAPAARRKR